ncbi:hypothetical protein MMAG44476_23759 [Mycolicibacterium mageritense DSM 44476 = CIP 104973]|nr:lipoprotein LpqH [Mycolicibacterium mageritense]MBN3456990.1 lipoprotein LpqH [Mycobacterium sp. DSM 3803]MCC9181586.1 lipoprotein LpqH [Mycolicibacterium mageritense]TXI57903.1 MAG: hypothetical protein E6Q55_24810 [Mycolicibacterium mageritense]CDO20883.1 19 kDa lipoprotein antigen LpqH-like protein [Mycolicibacterium mageritense DSM 44476 = CIP 104973]BDY29566.1 hypothetical protein hbim_03504 [Mycolicibacterium mageritense]
MKKILVGMTVFVAGAGAAVGCSSGADSGAPVTQVAAGGAEVSTGGAAEVTVGGGELAGLDPASVTCVRQGGKISVGSGSAGPQQALAVVMTDEATPKVESVALMVDGNALGVSDMMGVKTGSAAVDVDGETYTISGEAQGTDIKNPMAGMITKPFTIKVTCS